MGLHSKISSFTERLILTSPTLASVTSAISLKAKNAVAVERLRKVFIHASLLQLGLGPSSHKRTMLKF